MITYTYTLLVTKWPFLSAWKEANISPIFKTGKREEIINYWQISLLSVVSKIEEKCVALSLIEP
jgi:hypothetical protein